MKIEKKRKPRIAFGLEVNLAFDEYAPTNWFLNGIFETREEAEIT